jgi:hypothetical protein
MGDCYDSEVHLDRGVRMLLDEKLFLRNNPDKCGIFDIPLFHHSMCEATIQASKNHLIFNEL